LTDSFTISYACSCCPLALSSGDDNFFSCSVFGDAAVAAYLLLASFLFVPDLFVYRSSSSSSRSPKEENKNK